MLANEEVVNALTENNFVVWGGDVRDREAYQGWSNWLISLDVLADGALSLSEARCHHLPVYRICVFASSAFNTFFIHVNRKPTLGGFSP